MQYITLCIQAQVELGYSGQSMGVKGRTELAPNAV